MGGNIEQSDFYRMKSQSTRGSKGTHSLRGRRGVGGGRGRNDEAVDADVTVEKPLAGFPEGENEN